MPRRFSYSRRRMALEALEVRCNPSAIDPGTSIIIEPAAEAAGEPVAIGEIAPNQGQADGGRTNVEVFVTVTDTETSADAPEQRGVAEVSLNSFAGQTVRLRIASTSNRGKLIVGVDDARLSGGTYEDAASGGAGRDVLVGGAGVDAGGRGAGDDVLVGGVGLDASLDGQGRLLMGTDGSVWRNAGADATNDDNNHGTHVGGNDRRGWE